ncbi:hypothetical protein BABINDRAFT_160722 [Babjeviella inositovora NRRL Y-12698]|uniref:Uncharacterized protein n=1 Tax=Babjeviella inositovora NRRL Y-12698 TaxID=984486 RepID=A0A1E3QW98_9ASCO|nr:uncharacterized protein BABINDRAFT_160722 [Babjeviella inositovora NRRL Y-12698]ODQ81372.1 hypothetical protein BABINDRAFT_160722 [Babjeviella inositovora NRRL Y-12698]
MLLVAQDFQAFNPGAGWNSKQIRVRISYLSKKCDRKRQTVRHKLWDRILSTLADQKEVQGEARLRKPKTKVSRGEERKKEVHGKKFVEALENIFEGTYEETFEETFEKVDSGEKEIYESTNGTTLGDGTKERGERGESEISDKSDDDISNDKEFKKGKDKYQLLFESDFSTKSSPITIKSSHIPPKEQISPYAVFETRDYTPRQEESLELGNVHKYQEIAAAPNSVSEVSNSIPKAKQTEGFDTPPTKKTHLCPMLFSDPISELLKRMEVIRAQQADLQEKMKEALRRHNVLLHQSSERQLVFIASLNLHHTL